MRFPLIIILSLIPVFTGCGIYYPHTTDIPLIDHKGALRIDLGATVVPSIHSTWSFGLTDKLALQVFGSTGFEEKYYVQLSPGLYKCLANNKVLEFYSGFGFGHGYTDKNPFANMPEAIEQILYGNFQLYFIQLNWGKNTDEPKRINWGLGIKGGLFRSDLTDINYYSIYSEAGPFSSAKENSILLEPVFSLRTGNKKAGFTTKVAITTIINLSNPEKPVPAPFLNISLGLNLKLK